MTEAIPVRCLIDRYWDFGEYQGTQVTGELIDISTQTDEYNSSKLIPVGIVLLEGNTEPKTEPLNGKIFSVPVEFITKE